MSQYCTFCAEKRGYLLKHYRLKHGCHTRISQLPCPHKDCICTFKSFNALKVHLTKWHTQKEPRKASHTKFHCQLCDFVEPCTDADFFSHLRRHLKLKQKVVCPYVGCNFASSVYSTFNSHRSKEHPIQIKTPFKPEYFSEKDLDEPLTDDVYLPEDNVLDAEDSEFEFTNLDGNMEDLEDQLERNVRTSQKVPCKKSLSKSGKSVHCHSH